MSYLNKHFRSNSEEKRESKAIGESNRLNDVSLLEKIKIGEYIPNKKSKLFKKFDLNILDFYKSKNKDNKPIIPWSCY